MNNKLTAMAALFGAALTPITEVSANHLGYPSTHIIYGRAYFYSINFEALLTSLTGRDIKDGTKLVAAVKTRTTQTLCLNPQAHRVDPGNGPNKNLVLSSPNLTDADLDKSDRQKKNQFKTTATGDVVATVEERLSNTCKTSKGSGWLQVYWQDRGCQKGLSSGNTCYTDLAYLNENNVLIYLNGGGEVPECTVSATSPTCGETYQPYYNWRYVFLPQAFAFNAFVTTAGATDPDSNFYWSCQFEPNNEAGAVSPGAPYSLTNPPTQQGGFGGLKPAGYVCTSITSQQFADY